MKATASARPGMLLIREVADAPVIMGISKPAGLMKPDGSKHSSFSVQNNLGVAKLMLEKIVSAPEAMRLSDVVISPVCALREDGRLEPISEENPCTQSQIGQEVQGLLSGPAQERPGGCLCHCRPSPLRQDQQGGLHGRLPYKSLQTLTRARFDAVQNLTREKQHFANYLFLKCSGMPQDKDIANSSAAAIALTERFETVDELAYAGLGALTAFIAKSGRGRFADPEATAKAVQVAARGSYRLPKTVTDSVNQAMSAAIATMRAPDGQIKVLDKAIEQQFRVISNALTAINQ